MKPEWTIERWWHSATYVIEHNNCPETCEGPYSRVYGNTLNTCKGCNKAAPKLLLIGLKLMNMGR